MKKLITRGLAVILTCTLVFPQLLILSATRENPSLNPAPRSVKVTPSRSTSRARAKAQASTQITGQTATSLPDSRLLLIGGQGADGTMATVAIKDPRTGEVTSTSTSLNQARAWHTATMLPDGRVLVIGGMGANGKALASAEIFDPATQTFELLLPPRFAHRAYHTATLLTDGKVLIAGGISDNGRPSSSAQIWDFRTRITNTLPGQLSVSRQKHRAILLADGNVLLEGGIDENGNALAVAELYNTEGRAFNFTTITSNADESGAPFLVASLPRDGATDVSVESFISLRFSKPLRLETISTQSVKLVGSEGTIGIKVVPAENGRLAFITPGGSLLSGGTYTLTIAAATGHPLKNRAD